MDTTARDIIGDFTREVARDQVRGDIANEMDTSDVKELAQAWIQERSVHGILPSREDVVARVVSKVQRAQRVLEEQSADAMDGRALEADKTRAVLVEAELERVQFLLRAYTRTRISKAEQHVTREGYDDESEIGSANRNEMSLLTEDEKAYARARLNLVKSVLGTHRVTTTASDDEDDDEDEDADEDSAYHDHGEEHVIVRDAAGRVQAARWRSVQHAVLAGEAELV